MTKSSKTTAKKSAPASNPAQKTLKVKTVASSHSKQAMLIALLKRPAGASMEEMTKITGWQQHSVRGVLSGVLKKKLGLSLSSVQEGRGRIYRIGA